MNWIEARIKFRSKDISFLDIKNKKDFEENKEYKENTVESLKDIFYEFGLRELLFQDKETNIEDGFINQKSPFSGAIIGYFIDNRYSDSKKQVLREKIKKFESKDINKRYKLQASVDYKKVSDTDWKDNWKSYFTTTKIYENIIVKPKWEDYISQPGEVVINIDPENSFGTGTHPTTSLCIEKMTEVLDGKDDMIDIGTGSGILMVVAKKLGVKNITGIDIDPEAIKIAKKNLELNKINKNFKLYAGELKNKIRNKKFDLIIANMLSNIILEIIQEIKNIMKEDSIFIFSGILKEEKDVFISKLKDHGFAVIDINTKKDWISISGRLK
ncbi:MAG: 50S ribosomal protein L11 methyltransferase [Fusobacteriota bacterium]